MLKVCGECEGRFESVPEGSVEAIVNDTPSAVISECLKICDYKNKRAGTDGVKFIDQAEGVKDVKGAYIVGPDGLPMDRVEYAANGDIARSVSVLTGQVMIYGNE